MFVRNLKFSLLALPSCDLRSGMIAIAVVLLGLVNGYPPSSLQELIIENSAHHSKANETSWNSPSSLTSDHQNRFLQDGNFSELTLQNHSVRGRVRRSVVHLYDMVVCATGCNPLAYKGYGCYCGFLGSGLSVDGIDSCCAKHDWCYNRASCPPFMTYFVPYYWTCTDGLPHCVADYRGWKGICGTHLCECDRKFAECLRRYPCPTSRAMCMTSPWRFWQNLVMQPPLQSYDIYYYS